MSKLPSASKLHRELACRAATVLPHVDSSNPWSEAGKVKHDYCRNAKVYGREKALSQAPAEYREACEAIQIEKLEDGFTFEVAFAYDIETGEGRLIGTNVGREYGPRKPTEIVGSADMFRRDRGPVEIDDIKCVAASGHDSYAPAARDNWQLRLYALAACRAFGVSDAVVRIRKLYDDGTWAPPDEHKLDTFDLDAAAEELKRWYAQRKSDVDAYATFGKIPTPNVGSHCKYCPSDIYCPAKTALLREAAGDVVAFEEKLQALSPEMAGAAWQKLTALEGMVERAKAAIKEMAEKRPLPLPGGKLLAPVEQRKESVDGETVYRALSELCDRETAMKAVELKSSKAGIKRAITPVAKTRGVAVAQLEREVLGAVREAGGIKESRFVVIKEIRAGGDAGSTNEEQVNG
jgi:hypothetical protein